MNQEITEYLQILATPYCRWNYFGIQRHLRALSAIQTIGRPEDAPRLLFLLNNNNRQIARKAAATIRLLLLKKPLRMHIMHKIRSTLYAEGVATTGENNLFHLDPDRVATNFSADEQAHIYGLTSLAYNGYIRENALNQLAKITSDERIMYLVLRTTDWVEPVQKKAIAILETIDPKTLVATAGSLYFLYGAETKKRFTQSFSSIEILQKAVESVPKEQLLSQLNKGSGRARVFILKLILPYIGKDSLIQYIEKKKTPIELRRYILEHILAETDLIRYAPTLILDKNPAIRYQTLQKINALPYQKFQHIWRVSIADRSLSIRLLARYMMQQHEPILPDFSAMYRILLQTAPSAGTIAGLGETGTQEDAKRIATFTHHSTASIRSAALYALTQLSPEPVNDLINGLQDTNAQIRAIAAKGLLLQKNITQPLRQLLDRTCAWKTEQQALLLLVKRETLLGILYIYKTLETSDATKQEYAWTLLQTWHKTHQHTVWFTWDDALIAQIQEMRRKLDRTIEPPTYAIHAWQDIANIFKTAESLHNGTI